MTFIQKWRELSQALSSSLINNRLDIASFSKENYKSMKEMYSRYRMIQYSQETINSVTLDKIYLPFSVQDWFVLFYVLQLHSCKVAELQEKV
jgi:hypothetical protein